MLNNMTNDSAASEVSAKLFKVQVAQRQWVLNMARRKGAHRCDAAKGGAE
jgi:hypothetical protein